MALLVWDDVTWPAFVAGLESFRDSFPRAAHAPEPHGESAADIIRTLNRWACRISSTQAPPALEAWLRGHDAELDEVRGVTIVDPSVTDRAAELGALHDDLIHNMQVGGVRNMGPAAASKALHLLVPGLFVMWDREISRSAPEGYSAYLLQMHGLARRLAVEAPTDDVEAYLQQLLGYETRKTLAKYLDEYNWFEAVGREQLAAKSVRD
jgi:hypothetical protein